MVAPVLDLQAHVHPRKLARDDSEQMVTVRLDITAATEAPVRALSLALLIDKSGSMNGPKIETAKAAALEVVRRMRDEDSITVVAFNERAELVVPTTRLGSERSGVFDPISRVQAGGGTNIGVALAAAEEQMSGHQRPGQVAAVFLVTDGQDGAKEATRAAAQRCQARGPQLYSAGIGADYDEEFLAQICATKDRVDHVDQAEQMESCFGRFLQREGCLATAHGRLIIAPAPGVRLQRVTSVADRGQDVPVSADQTVEIRDLCAGQSQAYAVEFVVAPAAVGRHALAEFRVRCDLPAAEVRDASVSATAEFEVTGDASQANAPNPHVVQLSRKLQATRLAERAEQDLARSDVRGATEKLKRVTQKLKDLGEDRMAEEFGKQAQALEQTADVDLAKKRLRGTTKRLTQD